MENRRNEMERSVYFFEQFAKKNSSQRKLVSSGKVRKGR
jgi:hypothetical protein